MAKLHIIKTSFLLLIFSTLIGFSSVNLAGAISDAGSSGYVATGASPSTPEKIRLAREEDAARLFAEIVKIIIVVVAVGVIAYLNRNRISRLLKQTKRSSKSIKKRRRK